MLYKFVGASDDAALVDTLTRMLSGSIRFASATRFNDPFEFKFASVAPDRQAFDAWHREHAPSRSSDELENAWKSFEGPAAHWNTAYSPRMEALRHVFVLCLVERWNSHLMWAHYAGEHRGFVVTYSDHLLDDLQRSPGFLGKGRVDYRSEPPQLRWFQEPLENMFGPILFSKMKDWSYEEEYRIVIEGDPADAVYRAVDPALIEGIILGPRAPAPLIHAAIQAGKANPGLAVRQITAGAGYEMELCDVVENVRRASHML